MIKPGTRYFQIKEMDVLSVTWKDTVEDQVESIMKIMTGWCVLQFLIPRVKYCMMYIWIELQYHIEHEDPAIKTFYCNLEKTDEYNHHPSRISRVLPSISMKMPSSMHLALCERKFAT